MQKKLLLLLYKFSSSLIVCRKKKHVIVNNNSIVPYDHLILATGLQYQVPMPTGTDISTGMTTAETETSPDRRFVGTPPKNVFIVNDAFDAGIALNWVENNVVQAEGLSPGLILPSQGPVCVCGPRLVAVTIAV